MARMLRCEFGGAIYHVMSRGIERRDIYRNETDRKIFLEKLADCLAVHGVKLYAYTLMSNHFHLLLMTPRGNLSRFMQHFKTSYTVYFNAKHRRTGPLFSGRFKAPLVEGNEYLLKLMRYIHLNPVMTQKFKQASVPEKWEALRHFKWSSHPGYGGWAKKPIWLDDRPLVELLSEITQKQGVMGYRTYLRKGLKTTDDELLEAMRTNRKGIGSEHFRLKVESLYQKEAKKKPSRMDIAMRRAETTLPPDNVYQNISNLFSLPKDWEVMRGNRLAKDLLIESWMKYSGLTGREVGERLGHSDGAIVSRRLKWMKETGGHQLDYKNARMKIERSISNVKA